MLKLNVSLKSSIALYNTGPNEGIVAGSSSGCVTGRKAKGEERSTLDKMKVEAIKGA